jgi:GT2 family glycosyltransferase
VNDNLVTWINPYETVEVSLLNKRIFSASDFIIVAVPLLWQSLDRVQILKKLEHVHAVHSGLPYGGHRLFKELQTVSLNWNFLSPNEKINNYSWKATEHFIAFRKETFLALGGFDTSFTLTGSIAEFCYRVMRSGGLVEYVPPAEHVLYENVASKTSASDVVLFAARHLSINYARLLKFYFFLTMQPVFISIKNFQSERNDIALSGIVFNRPLKSVSEYTAIIPTILRYDYIVKSIESLKCSEFPPREIIVVDQTPIHLRKPQIYEPYIREGILRVFYLDKPGQCTSRNLAIREARTDWLLFFEDDTVAWPGMMQEHKYLIEHSLADVSTGVSLAPWKDESYILVKNRKYHVSDVLATGNCFMKKDTALSVGGLHPAFDQGPGADDDFGRRLFLSGKLILFNYKAIQTHYKAPIGGMRAHGVWWRNASSLSDAYPPPTQAFVIRKYYPSKYQILQFLIFYLKAKNNKGWAFILHVVFFPFRIFKSIRLSSALLKKFNNQNQ